MIKGLKDRYIFHLRNLKKKKIWNFTKHIQNILLKVTINEKYLHNL